MRKPRPKNWPYGRVSSPGRPVYSEVLDWVRTHTAMSRGVNKNTSLLTRQNIADEFMISVSTVTRIMRVGGIDLRNRNA